METSTFTIDGNRPYLVGLAVEEVLVTKFWSDGELADEGHELHLKFGDQPWLRAFFDGCHLFRRTADALPVAFEIDDLGL